MTKSRRIGLSILTVVICCFWAAPGYVQESQEKRDVSENKSEKHEEEKDNSVRPSPRDVGPNVFKQFYDTKHGVKVVVYSKTGKPLTSEKIAAGLRDALQQVTREKKSIKEKQESGENKTPNRKGESSRDDVEEPGSQDKTEKTKTTRKRVNEKNEEE